MVLIVWEEIKGFYYGIPPQRAKDLAGKTKYKHKNATLSELIMDVNKPPHLSLIEQELYWKATYIHYTPSFLIIF